MAEEPPAPIQPGADNDPFVDWMRQSTPYVHAHRGRTFVIAFGGEAVAAADFPMLIHDLALLHGLGIRLVLVHGARPQIEQRLAQRGTELRYVNGLRITDDAALACVKEAVGIARIEIEALLSLGLANSPMQGVHIPVASGNFVTARPLGVLEGVDYRHTGAVRRIDRLALRQRLDSGAVALLPPLGYSPTGEVFNLSAADVARSAAVALEADKLIFLTEEPGVTDMAGRLIPHLLVSEVDARLADPVPLPEDLAGALRGAAEACRRGIRRVHILSRRRNGALLRELFTRDGSGTLVTAEPFEDLRPARIDDVAGILELLQPLETMGVLVRRSRERLETEIDRFSILERDGMIIGCAALYPYPGERLAELACLAVHADYQRDGRGEKLLERVERKARDLGIERLFVLTTQTAHWFRERGFEPASLGDLPMTKQALYNYQRRSQVYFKRL
ncbi:amino-acid N-acetyltransferase [Thioflavicoccus mobilis 8321]|uniref:Amino-acid acetyltransferase n=1 Tax=Thioflavicoccus mobilis 8321 TaxID=765912 RepID=L0GZY8_9GAMM|nr:amino-acid N-acetyltransferase [Thioflavicoccus mobilis]AGA90940.1 amino-acid N-acetyltransferase [Thioflavicoccus mobilis 8321]